MILDIIDFISAESRNNGNLQYNFISTQSRENGKLQYDFINTDSRESGKLQYDFISVDLMNRSANRERSLSFPHGYSNIWRHDA